MYAILAVHNNDARFESLATHALIHKRQTFIVGWPSLMRLGEP